MDWPMGLSLLPVPAHHQQSTPQPPQPRLLPVPLPTTDVQGSSPSPPYTASPSASNSLDCFNDYYDPSLKHARQALLERTGVFVVEGDVNDALLLRKLFDIVSFIHVMHLAAQAGIRYTMTNPASYVHSNVAGLVSLLEAAKSVDPQHALIWASSSSVYGLNSKVDLTSLAVPLPLPPPSAPTSFSIPSSPKPSNASSISAHMPAFADLEHVHRIGNGSSSTIWMVHDPLPRL